MRALSTIAAGFAALVLATAASAQTEQRIALVVGVADYDSVASLRNPINDVGLISSTLEEIGFDVDLLANPDQRALEDAIIGFKQRLETAGEDAIALFYYAGHAVQMNGVNYLVPRDAVLTTEDQLVTRAVEANWVLGLMDQADVGANVIILDACRDNPFAASWPSDSRSAGTRGLVQVDPPRGSMLMFSTAPGAVALDGDGMYSPFAEVLAENITTPNLRAESMFVDVTSGVYERTGGAQNPWIEFSLQGEFYLGGQEAGGAGGDEDLITPDEFEQMYWDLIADSTDPDDFQDYLDNFPDGAFADDANAKIAELAPAATPTSPSFRVIDATLSAEPAEYTGRCPATVNFRGQISAVGGSGVVSYRFRRSDGETSPIATLAFDAPGTLEVTSSWTLGASGEEIDGWQVLEIYDPAELRSDRVVFSVACAEERSPADSGGGSRYVLPDRLLSRVTATQIDRTRVTGALNTGVLDRPAITARLALRDAAPALVSPDDNAVFDVFPRTMTFQWRAVSGAASYTLEVDAYGMCEAGAWCADVGGRTMIADGLTQTRHTRDFIGAQPGRWRVWAVYPDGREGPKSDWRRFRHRQ